MSSPRNGDPRYRIHISGANVAACLKLQHRAKLEGRGREVVAALREIARRLHNNPLEIGEPVYRLPAMRLQVRSASVRPLVVDFAICEDRPLVFIKNVWLLPKR